MHIITLQGTQNIKHMQQTNLVTFRNSMLLKIQSDVALCSKVAY